jgi:hypothetical protein
MRISTMIRCGGRQKQLQDVLQRRSTEIGKILSFQFIVKVSGSTYRSALISQKTLYQHRQDGLRGRLIRPANRGTPRLDAPSGGDIAKDIDLGQDPDEPAGR